jgi:L-fuconolactonase
VGETLSVRIVDAHVHLWDVDALPIPWFRDDLGLPRRASAADLGLAMDEAGAEAAIAVQAGDSAVEAEWLLDMARTDPLARRAVLQYDPTRFPGAGETDAAGIRAAIPQFAADLSDVARLDDLADLLGARGQVLELLIRPEQLVAAGALSRRHPSTAIVVCHLGLGAGNPDAAWRDALTDAATAPRLHAKVSGLALPSRDPDEAHALVRHAFDAFGADRLMFGSDWPMSVRSCTYAGVLDATRTALPHGLDTPAFWSGTASRLYRLPPPSEGKSPS